MLFQAAVANFGTNGTFSPVEDLVRIPKLASQWSEMIQTAVVKLVLDVFRAD